MKHGPFRQNQEREWFAIDALPIISYLMKMFENENSAETSDLFKALVELFSKNNLEISRINLEEYANIYNSGFIGSLRYSPPLLTYYESYADSSNPNIRTITLKISSKNEPVALWILSTSVTQDGNQISCQGEAVLPPIIKFERRQGIQNLVDSIFLSFIMSKSSEIRNISILDYERIGSNYLELSLYRKGFSIEDNRHLGIDLTPPLEEIRRSIRKSYKNQINRALENWTHIILTGEETSKFDELWGNFRKLHFESSGRITRSLESWNVQARNIQDGKAILVSAHDSNSMVGGALIDFSESEAQYSVGAYSRELFSNPVGHGVQWTAISYLKSRGIKRYRLGSINNNENDSKIDSINLFKQGFANTFINDVIFSNNKRAK